MSNVDPAPPAPPAYSGAPGAEPAKTLSLISLIAGIVGLFLGTIFSIGAIVLGFMGRAKEPQAKGMWLTGIILGFVGLVLSVFWIILIVSILGFAISQGTITYGPEVSS